MTGENRTLVEGSTAPRLSHSATVTLGVRGTNRTYLSGFSDRRLDHNGLPDEFGGDGENRTLIGWVQTSSPPVERHPRNTSWRLTRCTPRDLPPRSSRSTAMNLVAAAGVEPANDLPYESDLVPTSPQQLGAGPWNRTTLKPLYQSGAHPESMTDSGALSQSRTGFPALQEPRIAGNASRAEYSGAGGANRTLVSRLPCDGSPIELHRLEPKGGFEPPSEHYQSSVFPTKLLRQLERVTGFEPVSGLWQSPILAARRYPLGASEENRTPLACLEGRNSTNKSHSLELLQLTIHLSKNTLRRQRRDS